MQFGWTFQGFFGITSSRTSTTKVYILRAYLELTGLLENFQEAESIDVIGVVEVNKRLELFANVNIRKKGPHYDASPPVKNYSEMSSSFRGEVVEKEDEQEENHRSQPPSLADGRPDCLWKYEACESPNMVFCSSPDVFREVGVRRSRCRLSSTKAGFKILDEAGIATSRMELSGGVQLTRDEREDIQVDPIPPSIHPVHHAGRCEARAQTILRCVGSDAKAVLFVDAAEYSTRRAFGVSVVDGVKGSW
ncbi:hypothetical protein HPB50_011768 [Hyalomma asiaticum]|uniref:Uncharacterized protein n=1 Tax=Hyalomma asiaticum TaxID=266040 RepID=A0ACB7TGH6_HYAAI|nr:hypothetical protein HPB50_011768 [Hyalomma asiaticum]